MPVKKKKSLSDTATPEIPSTDMLAQLLAAKTPEDLARLQRELWLAAGTPRGQKIPPQQAAENAVHYLLTLIPRASDALLEEIELSNDGKTWEVTLSFRNPGDAIALFKRDYKVFKVDATTGEVRSMRIRKV